MVFSWILLDFLNSGSADCWESFDGGRRELEWFGGGGWGVGGLGMRWDGMTEERAMIILKSVLIMMIFLKVIWLDIKGKTLSWNPFYFLFYFFKEKNRRFLNWTPRMRSRIQLIPSGEPPLSLQSAKSSSLLHREGFKWLKCTRLEVDMTGVEFWLCG